MRGRTFILNIVLTEMCNLACKYCYVPHQEVSNAIISDEVIDKSMEIVEEKLKEFSKIKIDVFGGEPLICFDKVLRIIEKSEEIMIRHPGSIHVHIITNGTLLTKDMLAHTKGKKYVTYSISLDGTKESHDANRVYLDGTGTYDHVIKNMRMYYEYRGIKLENTNGIFVVSPQNVDLYYDVVKEMMNNGIKLFKTTFSREDTWVDGSIQKYKKQVKKVTDLIIHNFEEKGIMDLGIYPIYMSTMDRFCGLCDQYLSIAPNGDIYPCQRFFNIRAKCIIGNVFDGIDEDNIHYNALRNYTKDSISKCKNCKHGIKDRCIGQCLAACLEYNNNVFEVMDSACELIKIRHDSSKRIHEALSSSDCFGAFKREFER